MPRGHKDEPTRDHVFPYSSGFRGARNKIAVHFGCNQQKADRAPHPCEVLFCLVVHEMLDASAEKWAGAEHRRKAAAHSGTVARRARRKRQKARRAAEKAAKP